MRGLSILFVVIFHAVPRYFPNGYLGVDIFFALSGYLITLITVDEFNRNQFSVLGFYIRRIKRILPTALMVLFCTTVFALITLHYEEFENFKKYLASSSLFFTNYRILNEAGYFDVSNHYKPLMHFWSLSAEEQYYLFWPAALVLFRFVKPSRIKSINFIWPLFACFFATSIYFFVANNLKVIGNDDYYSLLVRCWEIMSGAGIALLMNLKSFQQTIQKVRENSIFNFGALSVFFFTIAILNSVRLTATVWIIMGALCAILNGSKGLLGQILRIRPLVYLGLVSYALYLWHWPVLSFLRIFNATISIYVGVLAMCASLILAFLTYELIEKPIKKQDWCKSSSQRFSAGHLKALALLGLCGLIFILAQFMHPFFSDGPKINYVEAKKLYLSDECLLESNQNKINRKNLEFCATDYNKSERRGLVVGDSHANAFMPGLAAKVTDVHWFLVAHNSCLPFFGQGVADSLCQNYIETAIAYAVRNNFDYILLINANRIFASSAVTQNFEMFKSKFFSGINGIAGGRTQVILFNPVPEIAENIFNCRNKRVTFVQYWLNDSKNCSINKSDWLIISAKQRKFNLEVKEKFPKVRIYDPADLICDKNVCHVAGENLFYSDKDHLSVYGSIQVAQDFNEFLKN